MASQRHLLARSPVLTNRPHAGHRVEPRRSKNENAYLALIGDTTHSATIAWADIINETLDDFLCSRVS